MSKIEESLNEMLQLEIKNLQSLREQDVSGKRVIAAYRQHVEREMQGVSNTEDVQVAWSILVNCYRNSPDVVKDLITESNITRREISSKIDAIKACLEKIKLIVEAENREKDRQRKLAEKIEKGDSLEGRKVGERPEKIKDIRKAKSIVANKAKEDSTKKPDRNIQK